MAAGLRLKAVRGGVIAGIETVGIVSTDGCRFIFRINIYSNVIIRCWAGDAARTFLLASYMTQCVYSSGVPAHISAEERGFAKAK